MGLASKTSFWNVFRHPLSKKDAYATTPLLGMEFAQSATFEHPSFLIKDANPTARRRSKQRGRAAPETCSDGPGLRENANSAPDALYANFGEEHSRRPSAGVARKMFWEKLGGMKKCLRECLRKCLRGFCTV